jgi:hypothetical protein
MSANAQQVKGTEKAAQGTQQPEVSQGSQGTIRQQPTAAQRTAQGLQASSQQPASSQQSSQHTPAASTGSGQAPVPSSASPFVKPPGRQSRERTSKRGSCVPVPDPEKAPDRTPTGGSTRQITGGPLKPQRHPRPLLILMKNLLRMIQLDI